LIDDVYGCNKGPWFHFFDRRYIRLWQRTVVSPKIGKIWFFGVKSLFFTRNTPTFSRLPPLGAICLSAFPSSPSLKSWIRPLVSTSCLAFVFSNSKKILVLTFYTKVQK
jgi:hypothetical protein